MSTQSLYKIILALPQDKKFEYYYYLSGIMEGLDVVRKVATQEMDTIKKIYLSEIEYGYNQTHYTFEPGFSISWADTEDIAKYIGKNSQTLGILNSNTEKIFDIKTIDIIIDKLKQMYLGLNKVFLKYKDKDDNKENLIQIRKEFGVLLYNIEKIEK